MQNADSRGRCRLCIVALLILVAALLRHVWRLADDPFLCEYADLMRPMIYIGLYVAWGVSVRRRIIHSQIRNSLLVVAVLLVFWLTVRTVKYEFAQDADVRRMLWYLFYIPMLFIPLMGAFTALRIGRGESQNRLGWMRFFLIPTAILAALVLTNDLHRLVFTFPAGGPWTDADYGYGPLYWAVIGWEILTALTALIVILSKCRVPRSKKVLWLPFALLGVAVAYGAAYVLGLPFVKVFVGDITIVQCLTYTAVLESCIQCGLIQSNSNYGELFRIASIHARITDASGRTLIKSDTAPPISEALLRQAHTAPVPLGGNMRLLSAPMSCGYVSWVEDVSELLGILLQMQETRAALQDANLVLQEDYRAQARMLHLREKNRLYDAMQEQTGAQVARMSGYLEQLCRAADEDEKRKLLGKLIVVGAYFKRRNNLVLLGEQNRALPLRELELCMEESAANLNLYGVECGLSFAAEGSLPAVAVMRVYDGFETVVETALDSLHALLIHAEGRDGGCLVRMQAECDARLDTLPAGIRAQRDSDGVWCIVLHAGGEGGAV